MATYRGESCSGHEYSIFLNNQTMFRLQFKYCKHNCGEKVILPIKKEKKEKKKKKKKVNMDLDLAVLSHVRSVW